VQEGDAAEPRAGGFRHVGIRGPACRREQEPFDLSKKDLRKCGDGRRTVGQVKKPVKKSVKKRDG
jgi:hypothetical protein